MNDQKYRYQSHNSDIFSNDSSDACDISRGDDNDRSYKARKGLKESIAVSKQSKSQPINNAPIELQQIRMQYTHRDDEEELHIN